MNHFHDYFDYTVEYPRDIAADILPIGTLYEYVSNTFLNGFINYVSIVKGYVLGRYLGWTEDQCKRHEAELDGLKFMCPSCNSLGTVNGAPILKQVQEDPDPYLGWGSTPRLSTKIVGYEKSVCPYCNGRGYTALQLRPVMQTIPTGEFK